MSNPILKAMSLHRSVRRYAPESLSADEVRLAVSAAQRAATSSNIQAYSVLQIKDTAQRERLAQLCGAQSQVAQAGGFFVICADQHRNVMLGAKLERPHQANLETFLLALIDASLFAQNLALAFESLGHGTCFIGGLRTELAEVDALLHLPPDVMPLFGLCAGAAEASESAAEARPRLPLEAILMQERYASDEEVQALCEAYDTELGAWYARSGRPGYTWSGGVSRNFQKPKRKGLMDYYRSKGAQFR